MTVLCNCSHTTYAELNGTEMIKGCNKYYFLIRWKVHLVLDFYLLLIVQVETM